MTGHVEDEFVQRAKSSGMERVFSKPVNLDDFGKLLMDCNLLTQLPKTMTNDKDSE